MIRRSWYAAVTVCAALLLLTSTASAQEPPAPAPEPAMDAAPPPPPALVAPAPPPARDGARFRGGVSVGGGLESVSVVSGPMFGVDGRLGVQLNNMLAFYAQPHLSFGSLSTSAGGAVISGGTGTFSLAGIAEVTLMDRFFAGAGFGYGILNNPSGAMFQARLGAYPLGGKGENGIRRKGLMVGADLRTIFIEGATGVLVTGSIGYEAF